MPAPHQPHPTRSRYHVVIRRIVGMVPVVVMRPVGPHCHTSDAMTATRTAIHRWVALAVAVVAALRLGQLAAEVVHGCIVCATAAIVAAAGLVAAVARAAVGPPAPVPPPMLQTGPLGRRWNC